MADPPRHATAQIPKSPHTKPPRFPILKGNQVAGALSARAVRFYAVVMALSVIAVLVLLGVVVHVNDVRHQQRVNDQNTTDLKVRTLGCIDANVIDQLDHDSPAAQKLVAGLRLEYSCSSLNISVPDLQSAKPITPKPKPSATARRTAGSTPGAQGPGVTVPSVVTIQPPPVTATRVTTVHVTPTPTPSRSHRTPSGPPTVPLLPVGSLVCQLLGICILR